MLAAGPAPTLERIDAPSNVHSTERSCLGASGHAGDTQDILLRQASLLQKAKRMPAGDRRGSSYVSSSIGGPGDQSAAALLSE
jgi:hypothetical protein